MTSHLLSKPTSCHSQLQWIVQGCNLDLFFFFNDTATTEIYPLSLHDALPICLLLDLDLRPAPAPRPRSRTRHRTHPCGGVHAGVAPTHIVVAGTNRSSVRCETTRYDAQHRHEYDRSESTRLNSSHANISYAVF